MSKRLPSSSTNFQFLQQHDPLWVQLCDAAERNFAAADPNTCLLKLRQLGEALAQHIAAVFGVDLAPDAKHVDLLVTLQRLGHVDRSVADMLHLLRQQGNAANYGFAGVPISVGQARTALKVARELATWFHRAFGNSTFKPGPFVEPVASDFATLTAHLEAQVALKTSEADNANTLVIAEQQKRRQLEDQTALLAIERSTWEQLAQEEERERIQLQAEFETRLVVTRAAPVIPSAESAPAQPKVSQAVALATSNIELDEDATCAIIDANLHHRLVVDRALFSLDRLLEQGAYANHGGFKAVNAAFQDNALEIIHQFEDAVWQDAA